MALSATGFTLAYASTSGGSYTTIPNIEDFQVGKEQVHRIDITDLTSAIETPLQGIIKIDDFSFTQFYTESNFTLMTATLFNLPFWFKATYSDTTTIVMHGWLSEIDVGSGKPNEAIKMKGKITIDQVPTYTAG